MATYEEFLMAFSVLAPVGAVEIAMVSQDQAQRSRPFYIQEIHYTGDDILGIRMAGPQATFFGQSLHFDIFRDGRDQVLKAKLPVQMKVVRQEDLQLFATNISLSADVHVEIICTYVPLPGKPVGFMYSTLSSLVAAGPVDTPEDFPTIRVPALDLGLHTLIGGRADGSGPGQDVLTLNLSADRWGKLQTDSFVRTNGPLFRGSTDGNDSDGIDMPIGEYKLEDSDDYIQSLSAVAGTVRVITYWKTDRSAA